MAEPLRLLIVEDVEDHALLLVRELQKGGFAPTFQRVETPQELESALAEGTWDAVISDFRLPTFSGLDALRIVQGKGPDIPFILVSGVLSEEMAVEAMRRGAHDFILKGNLARLVPALERELREAAMRRKRKETEQELIIFREHLEECIQDRTSDLTMANDALQAEIRERRRTEAVLRESEERFHHMADKAPVFIWMAGADAACTFFNERWLNFTGRSIEQELGMGWSEGLHPDDRQRCLDIYLTAFEQRREFEMEYRIRRADGEYRWVVDRGVPRFTPYGSFMGYIGTCFDITDSKRAREEISRLNADLTARAADLEDLNRELETFNYTVAHDLRNPLNIISSACQVIKALCGEELDEQCSGYLGNAYDGALRMNRLIGALLEFSRSAHVEPRRETVDLSDMVQDVAAKWVQSEPERRVTFVIADGVSAEGDSSLLRVVLDNLIGNAWKYTAARDEGIIEFGTLTVDGTPAYFVRDNGVGFDIAEAEKLFTPFTRLADPEKFRGSGIGLATVERIIRRHAGRIWAEGEPDRGATFYFTVNLPEATD